MNQKDAEILLDSELRRERFREEINAAMISIGIMARPDKFYGPPAPRKEIPFTYPTAVNSELPRYWDRSALSGWQYRIY